MSECKFDDAKDEVKVAIQPVPKARPGKRFDALIVGLSTSLVLWYGLVALVIQRYPPSSWEDRGETYAELLFPLFWAIFVLLPFILSRRQLEKVGSSSILLNLGRTQEWKTALGAVCVFGCLFFGVLQVVRLPPPGQKGGAVINGLYITLLWSWIAVYCFVSGSAPTLITQSGIQWGWSFLPWDQVESWCWRVGYGGQIVFVLKKGNGEVCGRVKKCLFVRAEQQAAVERILAERLQVTTTLTTAKTDQGMS